MEEFNRTLFLWINATPHAPLALLMFARFIAKDLILVVPLTIVVGWLWGNAAQLPARRVIISQATLTLIITLLLAQIIGWLLPHPRPFTIGSVTSSFSTHPIAPIPAITAVPSSALHWRFFSGLHAVGSAAC